MKKYASDWKVVENIRLHSNYCLLKLSMDAVIPEMLPGQFVQVRVDGSQTTFLRRPISVNYIDRNKNELWLLIQLVGDGTRNLAKLQIGETVNLLYPLGNSFSIPKTINDDNVLLIGGGVGVAPLLYLGSQLTSQGYNPTFLLGARSRKDLLLLEEFQKYGEVFVTTEDGKSGEKGYVTNHSILKKKHYDFIYTCGPSPMMHAVAAYAKQSGIPCEVSLENLMACGIGACLCCVENTTEGHICVCTEGPVINIEKLKWQI
ncbi:MAG: dihydroorotate dehydrogenase electron transfer subunit [Dysgonamonadaceae bacterium]|jgi:dihydroorotate dehydrogenase electron transfer subunit|nr:dihydroorotate dehydrogenase electron transfer subunit [Dysgonamonadaceae bacterium]